MTLADPAALLARWRLGRTSRPQVPSTHPHSTAAALTVVVLRVTSLLAAWFLLYAFVLSYLQEQRSQHELYSTFRHELATEYAPAGGAIALGRPVALLQLPQAGLHDAVVVEGTTSSALEKGPGHQPDTPLPGQAGDSVVFGRSATFGAPFAHLASERAGDIITVTTGQGTFHYRVTDLRRPGQPQPAALSPGAGRLTLEGATGAGWRSGLAPQSLVYLDATLEGPSVATPPGAPASVPGAESAMHGDTAVLLPLLLWLQLFGYALLAVGWAARRWGGRQAWLFGLPLILALLWEVTGTAFQLLPNLL
jgi:sortase A